MKTAWIERTVSDVESKLLDELRLMTGEDAVDSLTIEDLAPWRAATRRLVRRAAQNERVIVDQIGPA